MVYLLFKGARYEFLSEQLAAYDAAVASGMTKEFLDVIYARYARRFPIELPLEEDPSPEFLESVDDDAPEPEPENEGHVEELSPEELEAEMAKIADRQALIQKCRKQIATWFQYRHMKQHNVDPRATDPSNPFTSLLYSITGIHPTEKPRQKSAVNCWSKSQTSSINKLVREACIANNVGRKNSMAVWNRIAREQFAKLPEEKKRTWEKRAKDDHAKDLQEWKAARDAAISTKPEDRQRCIEGVVRLGQEFVDKLAEATGWKWTLIGGGPEPASEGRLSVISLHGGTTNGEVKLNFGQKERELYLSQILPVFSKFLRTCYTPEECRRRALTAEAIPLEEAGLEDLGITFDVVPPSEATVDGNTTPAPPCTRASTLTPFTLGSGLPLPASTTPAGASSPNDGKSDSEDQPRDSSPPGSVVPSPLGSPAHSPSRRGRSPSIAFSLQGAVAPDPAAVLPIRMSAPTSSSGLNSAAISLAGSDGTVVASTGPDGTISVPSSISTSGAHLATSTSSSNGTTLSALNDEDNPAEITSVTRTSGRKRQSSACRDASQSKRSRISHSPAPAYVPIVLQDTPWFAKAIEMLEKGSFGEAWTNLVQTWTKFEEVSIGRASGSIPARGRPTVVGDWIQRARNPNYCPVIKDTKALGDKHIAWWSSLQPDWRSCDNEEHTRDDSEVDNGDNAAPMRVGDGDLENLRKPGVNGILSVVASLYFWGSAVKESGKKSRRWVHCVEDCTYVLEYLSSST